MAGRLLEAQPGGDCLAQGKASVGGSFMDGPPISPPFSSVLRECALTLLSPASCLFSLQASLTHAPGLEHSQALIKVPTLLLKTLKEAGHGGLCP